METINYEMSRDRRFREILCYHKDELPSEAKEKEIVDFLRTHLEQYGDPTEQIQACLDYALARNDRYGGFVLVTEAVEQAQIVAALIMNKTGMKGYIPENILVYVATDAAYRGQGLGKQLLDKCRELCPGEAIALHCDMDNPARKLYEREGFKIKYYEMRREC